MNDAIRDIYRGVLKSLREDELKPGDRIPREVDLAKRHGTNRMNAHRAVKELEARGFVRRLKRSGTFIRDNVTQNEVEDCLKESGRTVHVIYSSQPTLIHWNDISFKALETELSNNGFAVVHKSIPTDSGRGEFKRLLSDADSRATALIILPDTHDTKFLAANNDLLLDLRVPVMMLNRSGGPLPFDMVSLVSMDPFGEGIKVGTLLSKDNRRKVIMLNLPSKTHFWSLKRFEGLAVGLRRCDEQFSCDLRLASGLRKGLKSVIETIKSEPGQWVVVPVHNQYAAKLVDAAARENLRPPKDFMLITFDDNPLYRSYNFTSMAAPFQEIGELFGKLITEKTFFNIFQGKISIKVPGELVVRETYKPV